MATDYPRRVPLRRIPCGSDKLLSRYSTGDKRFSNIYTHRRHCLLSLTGCLTVQDRLHNIHNCRLHSLCSENPPSPWRPKPIQSVQIHDLANGSMKFSTIVAGCVFTGFASCRPSKRLTIIPGTLEPSLGVADCDSNPDWTARNFVKEDCYVSVLDMFLQDYRSHPQAQFEFYSNLYPAPLGSNRLQTPKRYTTSG